MMLQGSISRSCANVLNILVLSAVLYRNLVTFGSPHQGVFGIPECEAEVPAFLGQEYFHTRWEIHFSVSWRAS